MSLAALKREISLFRLLKEQVGEHPNIVRLHEVYLSDPPFYLAGGRLSGLGLLPGGVPILPRWQLDLPRAPGSWQGRGRIDLLTGNTHQGE